MRFAIVRGQNVENVVELRAGDLGAKWNPPAGTVAVPADAHAEPGGTYDGGAFTRAPAPAPVVDPLEELAARVAALEAK